MKAQIILASLLVAHSAFSQSGESSEEKLQRLKEKMREAQDAVSAAAGIKESELSKYPDVKTAHETAQIFLTEAFSRDFTDAERMMNPALKPKGESIADFRNRRAAAIKKYVESKEKFGSVAKRETKRYGLGKQLPEKPPDEVYYQFVFETTYLDGTFSNHFVYVMQKNGAFWIQNYH